MEYVSQQITAFTATNLTDTYDDYNPATTYTFETGTPTNASVCRVGTYYYRSLINGNIGNEPTANEDVKWIKWGVSNKHAMLDFSAQSKSTFAGDLYVIFKQNQIRTLGIGNYEAETITIEILDASGNVLWSYETDSSVNENVIDYWSYIYEDYGYQVDRAFKIDLPLVGDRVKVTFNKSSESTIASCGFLVGGLAVNMGETLTNIDFSFNSYAIKEFDDFGKLTITKRAVQDLVDFETAIDTNEIVNLKREIKKIYNDIIMFVLDESETSNYENLITLGTIQDASVILTEFDKTIISYSIIEAV